MKLIGLDVGEKRIGVAKADSSVKIATPVGMIPVDGSEFQKIVRFVTVQNIDIVIVGMPRNLKGEETKQSAYIRDFVKQLNKTLLAARPNNKVIKIFLQDESLTSVEAKTNLKNKKGGINKKAGDIDAEAATLILQDFLENLVRRLSEKRPLAPSAASGINPATATAADSVASTSEATSPAPAQKPKSKKTPSPQFEPYGKTNAKKWSIIRSLIVLFIIFFTSAMLALLFYRRSISPVVSAKTCATVATAGDESDPCRLIEVTVEEGASLKTIASALREAGIIRSRLGFRIFNQLNHSASELQAGTYRFAASLSVSEIVDKLKEGTGKGVVFRFTTLPGETLNDVKKRLISAGYPEEEVVAALEKHYDHPVLKTKPADASLEGYLFGETYEFYSTDSVETIIIRMLDELYSVIQKNNLESKFNSYGLTLHEGIILASIVQKEAGTLSKDDQKTVAQVFLSRLNLGLPLGSDVTVKYALDLEDPERKTYTDNAAALEIDSCYNTRKNPGLPCGPISNPGSLVLISTANPSDTSYLYFLTGDDGLMYYSNTESEHNLNISAHCQELCKTSL